MHHFCISVILASCLLLSLFKVTNNYHQCLGFASHSRRCRMGTLGRAHKSPPRGLEDRSQPIHSSLTSSYMSSDIAQPLLVTIQQVDEVITNDPLPPRTLATLTSFEQRFLVVCPIYSHLLYIKRFFREHPGVDEGFKSRRTKQMQITLSNPQPHFREGFEKVFKELNSHSKFAFSRGKIARFLDLGCSPGGFSNQLLKDNPRAQGVGMTLPDEQAKIPLATKGTCLTQDRYHVHYENIITYTLRFIAQEQNPVVPLTAEGPIELYDAVIAGAFPTLEGRVRWWLRIQLVLSQILIVFSNVAPGGNAVILVNIKPFRWLAEVFRMLRLSFEEVTATKSKNLHNIRTSCYLVCKRFKASQEQVNEYTGILRRVLVVLERIAEERRLGQSEARPKVEVEDTTAEASERIFPTHRSDSDMPHLFPDSEEDIFNSEHPFMLSLMEPLWALQYNAIHDELATVLFGESCCFHYLVCLNIPRSPPPPSEPKNQMECLENLIRHSNPPSSNHKLPTPPQSPTFHTDVWLEASNRRPSISSPPSNIPPWRRSPQATKLPTLTTDLSEIPHSASNPDGPTNFPSPVSPSSYRWRPPQMRRASMVASSNPSDVSSNWRVRETVPSATPHDNGGEDDGAGWKIAKHTARPDLFGHRRSYSNTAATTTTVGDSKGWNKSR